MSTTSDLSFSSPPAPSQLDDAHLVDHAHRPQQARPKRSADARRRGGCLGRQPQRSSASLLGLFSSLSPVDGSNAVQRTLDEF